MALYKRGNTWWYKFQFKGLSIRESAGTNDKALAAKSRAQTTHRTG